MLIYAANTVKAHGGSVAQMRFYGQEVNQTSTAIGRMNLFIHQVEDAKILREDTLNKPLFVDGRGKLDQFDVVLANPPFSLKDWGSEKWAADPHKRAVGGAGSVGSRTIALRVRWLMAACSVSLPNGSAALSLRSLSARFDRVLPPRA